MHQPPMSLRRFGAFLRSNAAASARDWQSQSPPARKCPFIPSWTLIDVPTTGSILIYSHFVQTVLTSRLPFREDPVTALKRTIKTHSKRALFYNAFIRHWLEVS